MRWRTPGTRWSGPVRSDGSCRSAASIEPVASARSPSTSSAPSKGQVAAGRCDSRARSASRATSEAGVGSNTGLYGSRFMNHYSEVMADGTDGVRYLSKLLMGNADRVEVAAAVGRAEAGRLYTRSLAEDLRWPDNRVQKQLKQFEAAGLLLAMPSVGGERRVYYERRESVFWTAAAALEREWAEKTADSVSVTPSPASSDLSTD